jgi:hypothetical protein
MGLGFVWLGSVAEIARKPGRLANNVRYGRWMSD